MTKKGYELTEAEWALIQAVWDNEPCAAPTVQEALQNRRNWTYSTVKTMMDRMVAKGLLKTERIRNLILYRSAITRRQAQKGEVTRTIKRAEVFKNGSITHHKIGGREAFEMYFDEAAPAEPTWYYVRVTQSGEDSAWSSPIWVTP